MPKRKLCCFRKLKLRKWCPSHTCYFLKPRSNDHSGHSVVQCYDMLGVVGSNLTIFKTCRNTAQQGGRTRATCCAKQCCVCMLRSFGRGLMWSSENDVLMQAIVLLDPEFRSYIINLSNRLQVSMVYRLINHAGCWKICKSRAEASDLRILRVFFQHHKWFISL